MGSKNRHAKQILPLILAGRKENQPYVEPFVGGANVIDKVTGFRVGTDINPYLIALLQAASKGWLPQDNYTEEQYQYIKANKDENPVLTGYFGFALSYGGKWFGGWCRDSKGERNYVKEAYKNALKQFPLLKGASFECSNYNELEIPENSIIYCDPPYRATTSYKDNTFDSDKFFDWCTQKADEGHLVFVSEYSAPPNFTQIWEKTVTSSLTADTGEKKAVEKLFTIKKDNL